MKRFVIIAIMLVFFKHAEAQNVTHTQQSHPHIPVRLDPEKDKLEYKGYTIRLIPTRNGYYGYDILKGPQIIVHQYDDPIPGKGLSNRDDAFTLAKQVIEEYAKTGHIPPAGSPAIAAPSKQTPLN